MRNASKFPRRAEQYNDIVVFCPNCHTYLVIFEGFRQKHKCHKCGYILKDRKWKSDCAYYKDHKNI